MQIKLTIGWFYNVEADIDNFDLDEFKSVNPKNIDISTIDIE
jgi:hypothetical protein